MGVFGDSPNPIVTQAVFIIQIVSNMGEFAGCRLQTAQAAALGAKPESAVIILVDFPHAVVADAFRHVRIVLIAFESIGARLEAVQAILGANPDGAATVLVETEHRTGCQADRIGRIVHVLGECLCFRVKSIQAAKPGRDPDHAGCINQ